MSLHSLLTRTFGAKYKSSRLSPKVETIELPRRIDPTVSYYYQTTG